MRTNGPEKLLQIVEEIDAQGHANLTRLTILKKWFEHPGRLPAFGLWVARRSAARKGQTKIMEIVRFMFTLEAIEEDGGD